MGLLIYCLNNVFLGLTAYNRLQLNCVIRTSFQSDMFSIILKIVLLFEVVTCGLAPSLENGFIVSSKTGPYGGGLYGYNSTIVYKCNVGYWFSPGIFEEQVTCLNSGNWSLLNACSGTLLILK